MGTRGIAVVDEALAGTDLVDHLLAEVAPEATVTLPPGEPRLDTVRSVTDEVRRVGAGVVIAIGGGSTLDTAKIAGAAATSEHDVSDHLMGRTRFGTPLPLLAIPTTAGSGAEVTRMAVVSDHGRKSWAWDDALRPAAALLDPVLTATMPESVTVATGCDAFVHALESSSAQNHHEANAAAGAWAAAELVAALPAVIDVPDDVAVRGRVQRAATAAGIGIDRCGTGIGHAIGHAVASLLDAPHGLLVMLGTLVAIDWGVANAGERYAALTAAIEPRAHPQGLPDLIRTLAGDVGFERHLAPFAEVRLDAAALAAELPRPEHRPMWSNNAAVPTADDLSWMAEATAAEWKRIGSSPS